MNKEEQIKNIKDTIGTINKHFTLEAVRYNNDKEVDGELLFSVGTKIDEVVMNHTGTYGDCISFLNGIIMGSLTTEAILSQKMQEISKVFGAGNNDMRNNWMEMLDIVDNNKKH